MLNKPLQWIIVCLLHTNDLTLRHVFVAHDGSTSGLDTFARPIGKKLHGLVSSWTTAQFKTLSTPSSFSITEQVVGDLSTDQFYAYYIYWALIHGKVNDDLAYCSVDPLFIRDGSLSDAEFCAIMCLWKSHLQTWKFQFVIV